MEISHLGKDHYPETYLIGPEQDAGVDVLSDLGDPPERGWQAKNYFDIGGDLAFGPVYPAMQGRIAANRRTSGRFQALIRISA